MNKKNIEINWVSAIISWTKNSKPILRLTIKVAKKTTKSSPNDNWTYGYPKEQKPETKDYVIIGLVDFKNKNVEFYGWITGKDISNFEVVTKNSFAGYNYLTPNHEFEWGDLNKKFEKLFEVLKN